MVKDGEEMANEKRLIDANKARSKAIPLEGLDGNGIPYEIMAVPIDALDDAPTVDAVEVVRCKDCKHRYTMSSGHGFCREHFPMGKYDDDFCSLGERKDNERKAD